MTSFIEKMARSFLADEFQISEIEGPEMQQLVELYELFMTESSAKSRIFAFWSMYIKMAGNYLLCLHSSLELTRESQYAKYTTW